MVEFRPQKISHKHDFYASGVFTPVMESLSYKTFIIIYYYILNNFIFFIGSGWKVLDGCEEGQTQESCDLYTNKPVWDHPIDVHYTTQTLQNSPKLLLQIFHRDTHGRLLFGSYGVCNIPLSPGLHSIKCHTWKPIGRLNIF